MKKVVTVTLGSSEQDFTFTPPFLGPKFEVTRLGADNDTALLVPPGDSEALAARIATALDDPELRARIGAAGRQRVVERWSWKHCAQLTVDQYREVLAMPANIEKLRTNGRI